MNKTDTKECLLCGHQEETISHLLRQCPVIAQLRGRHCDDQGRAVGVVAGATRAFGRRTQGVWGAGPPTARGEPSGYQALKPPQINIYLTKSLKYESFRTPKIGLFLADNRVKLTSRS